MDQDALLEEKLQNYLDYAASMENKLQLLLKESKMDESDLEIKDEDDYVQCPFDPSHRVYKQTYDDHMWHIHHYNTKLEPPKEIDFFYETAPHLKHIHIDPEVVQYRISNDIKLYIEDKEIKEDKHIDYDKLPIIDTTNAIPIDFYSRMDPMEMETTVNSMKQLPVTFFNVQFPLIAFSRLDSHISYLFGKLGILQDQDLVNMVIAILINQQTNHPDIMTKELAQFMGSQTRTLVLGIWKYLAKIEIKRIRKELIRNGDPTVLTKREPLPSEQLPSTKWEVTETGEKQENKKGNAATAVIDYKRRRQSYRAKMTHLTKRTTIQEHRDIINMRMTMLAEENDYHLVGTVDRVTTKTTPQDIENELRRKRITPENLQFKNPLDARDHIRRKGKYDKHHYYHCLFKSRNTKAA